MGELTTPSELADFLRLEDTVAAPGTPVNRKQIGGRTRLDNPQSLQRVVLGSRLEQDGDVLVGILPEREEVLVEVPRLLRVAG